MKLAIYGAGGFGRMAADLIGRIGGHTLAGFLDDSPAAQAPAGLVLLGGRATLPTLKSRGVEGVCVAVGDNRLRAQLAEAVRAAGLALPTLADPSAVIAASARVGEGCMIGPQAVIGAGAVLEGLVLIGAGSVIEHDARVGRAARVGPRCLVDARAVIAPEAALPGGAVLAQGVLLDEQPPDRRI